MPQTTGRPPRGGGHGGGRGAGSGGGRGAGSEAWQAVGGGFSAKKKKDYLKWKRSRKAAAAGNDSDGGASEAAAGAPPSGAGPPRSRTPAAAAADPAAAAAVAAAPAGSWAPGGPDDPTLPLRFRPLAAVPAAPFAVGPLDAGGGADGAGAVALMPRLDPAEVGHTPEEGWALGMPTRPAWQGVVSSAEELHALEEREFAAWQDALLARAGVEGVEGGGAGGAAPAAPPGPLPAAAPARGGGTARAGGVGRLSFYEGRLEFWRQLWRTLELSDVVVMLLDARNPLLHFSHALYAHVSARGLPLVLVLNKCDLVPAAAAAAWVAWLEASLPGVRVVAASAAEGHAAAAARRVLGALLGLTVERGGRRVGVGEFVGMGADELAAASALRNTHAKRHLGGRGAEPQRGDAGAPGDAGGASDVDELGSGASDSDGSWSLRPGRGARAAKRDGRRSKAKQHQQQQQARQERRQRAAGGRGARAAAAAGRSDGSDVGGSSSEEEDEDEEEEEEEEGEALGSEAGREHSDLLSALTLERQLSSAAGGDEARAGAAAWADDSRPIVIGLLGEPNTGKSSTLNALLGTHRVAVSSHPGRTKHYQTHWMTDRLVLCDCPGIVFPRLDVSMSMQVLFGSYPIASCRQPYAVLRYLAEASWPRLHERLGLAPPGAACSPEGAAGGGGAEVEEWSPWRLAEALAEKRRWVLPRGGRLDTYRAANHVLRAALAGRGGLGLAWLPPAE
ncbi:Gnl1 [Scenedesmus sp. PABB004]|nr:Gnl1 [Scenedesmus sp. PABB004]